MVLLGIPSRPITPYESLNSFAIVPDNTVRPRAEAGWVRLTHGRHVLASNRPAASADRGASSFAIALALGTNGFAAVNDQFPISRSREHE